MKILIFCGCILASVVCHAQNEKEFIYVGTYSLRGSKGIYVYELNRIKGSMKLIQTVVDLESPTYLEIHPSGKYLYSVNRAAINKQESTGSASSFSIDRKTGKLTLLNHVSSFGKDPCHISIDKSGEWAFVSNYNEGNLVVIPILQDGSLGAPSDSKKYSGSGINRFRQEQPHIHSAVLSPENRYVYVSDLGTDKIYTYQLDKKTGRISPAAKSEVVMTAGAGPRHFAFHPEGNYAYSAQELTSTVGVFAVDKTTGALTLLKDTVRSVPVDAKEINTSADIQVDAKGKFLYVSNRGIDAISIFAINADGTINLLGQQKTLGKTPRNFLLDKKGKYLWVANQNSDNITCFRLNPKTGKLVYTGTQLKVPSPVCIKQLIIK
jgi:6-phosphogluconolactonase